ncbi:hypothetical protein FGE12_13140 [Aggregicoccus sp. 17bor-14]|uniref:hypothetical protein n=1 Tax=Myxococcaceae TaxID=31 RepID=UPI00129C3A30|nr:MULTISPECIES: hypothetical protein [Myxococcaceae]MBF5043336.1 hypothetical protein [Simulacricoccus sp. 17bor-14]MRI89095.1 hypothetical protein [Aggregicoccus sp. 17bor-14]
MAMLGLVVAGVLALAQQDAPVHEVKLEPGSEVRARLHADAGAQVLRGRAQEAPPGVLRLQLEGGAVREVPLVQVQALEAHRNGALAGALWGGTTLGWASASFTTFVGILANGLRESGSATPMPFFTGAGALVGAVLGAGVGVVVGSRSERWPALHGPGAGAPAALRLSYGSDGSAPFARRDRVELGLGLGLLLDPDEYQRTMVGSRVRLHLLVPLTERLALGPEASLGQLDHFVDHYGELDEDLTQASADVGLRARYWLGNPGGALRPLLSAGAALHLLSEDAQFVVNGSQQSREVTELALSFGGGVDWVPVPGAPGFTLEALWRQGLHPEGPRTSHLELSLTSALRF